LTIHRVAQLDLRLQPKPWMFAELRRAEINAHFAALQRANPRLFNGRVLVMSDRETAADTLHGGFFETDYASFRSWLDWGCPSAGAYDCFAAACVVSADGAVIFGEMAAHTSNAGQVYFPCGTPDRDDVIAGRVDLLHSCTRELKEETGFDAAEFSLEPGWRIVELPSRVVAVKLLRSRYDAETLRAQALAHLRSETLPELADIRVLRGRQDIDAAVPDFAAVFLRSLWP
jgi:8-oxo-dGTP pyrophosphatase MutT (NUDIX family)